MVAVRLADLNRHTLDLTDSTSEFFQLTVKVQNRFKTFIHTVVQTLNDHLL